MSNEYKPDLVQVDCSLTYSSNKSSNKLSIKTFFERFVFIPLVNQKHFMAHVTKIYKIR